MVILEQGPDTSEDLKFKAIQDFQFEKKNKTILITDVILILF